MVAVTGRAAIALAAAVAAPNGRESRDAGVGERGGGSVQSRTQGDLHHQEFRAWRRMTSRCTRPRWLRSPRTTRAQAACGGSEGRDAAHPVSPVRPDANGGVEIEWTCRPRRRWAGGGVVYQLFRASEGGPLTASGSRRLAGGTVGGVQHTDATCPAGVQLVQYQVRPIRGAVASAAAGPLVTVQFGGMDAVKAVEEAGGMRWAAWGSLRIPRSRTRAWRCGGIPRRRDSSVSVLGVTILSSA